MSLAGPGAHNLVLEGFPRFYYVGQLLHQPMDGRARLLYDLLSFSVLSFVGEWRHRFTNSQRGIGRATVCEKDFDENSVD